MPASNIFRLQGLALSRGCTFVRADQGFFVVRGSHCSAVAVEITDAGFVILDDEITHNDQFTTDAERVVSLAMGA